MIEKWQWLTIAVFGALPIVGLVAGPSYAALVFGLGIAQAALGLAAQRRLPPIDRPLALLAVAFAVLCWASVAWSIDPHRSEQAALQVTAIFAGALLFLASPSPADTERLFHTMAAATVLGAVVLTLDTAAGYRLQALLVGPHPDVGAKYNRGVDYLVLIAWPQLAFAAHRRDWRRGVALIVSVAVSVALGLSLAAQVAVITGLLALLLAWWLPRAIAPLATIGTVLVATGQPVVERLMATHRAQLAPYLKYSGLHRLEIWDYMTARVTERPLLGWGIAGANEVPITPQEFSHYVVVRPGHGIYPHDQWLQLWVETGAIGALLGLALALLVLWRIRRIPPGIRAFAYATFASAAVVASVNFEVMTDSWWAALAASAFLFDAVVSTRRS
jgi:exopolysaccharide production protein ExoQ